MEVSRERRSFKISGKFNKRGKFDDRMEVSQKKGRIIEGGRVKDRDFVSGEG